MTEYTFREKTNFMASVLTPYREAKELDGGGNIIYYGQCGPGGLKAQAVWRIQKWVYTDGFLTDIVWADGTDSFTKIWANRATYTYTSAS